MIDFQRGDSESPDCYPVRLRAITGKNLTISSPTDFGQARQQAEFLARLLRFPLADATTEHEVVLTPEQAGASLQERSSSAVGPAEQLATPPVMRSRVSELGRETIITIPQRMSRTAGAAAGIVAGLMLLIVAPVLWRLMSPGDSHSGLRLIFFAFLIFFFGVLPLVASATAFGLIRNQVVVTASPDGLIIERQGISRVRSETIPACEILDVDYSTMQDILEAQRASQPGAARAERAAGCRRARKPGAEQGHHRENSPRADQPRRRPVIRRAEVSRPGAEEISRRQPLTASSKASERTGFSNSVATILASSRQARRCRGPMRVQEANHSGLVTKKETKQLGIKSGQWWVAPGLRRTRKLLHFDGKRPLLRCGR